MGASRLAATFGRSLLASQINSSGDAHITDLAHSDARWRRGRLGKMYLHTEARTRLAVALRPLMAHALHTAAAHLILEAET